MRIRFSKMHGLGNDFIVINAIDQRLELDTEQIRFMADRHFGIGCDQVLLVEQAQQQDVDFHYRIFNADGGEVNQCGNGARCFARFVRDQGLTDKDQIVVSTAAGVIQPRIEPDGRVTVNMGSPSFEPEDIPFIAEQKATNYLLDIDVEQVEVGVVSMGNPHAILIVDDVSHAPVQKVGPLIESNSRFPDRVNVGFMELADRGLVRLRVYERGVGETLACGSGACAAMVVGHCRGLLNDTVTVVLTGGDLQIRWQGGNSSVYMTGPAVHVFEGVIEV
ncbi:MAG: diaminopimelate epimerase [Gammaproteobacteria bacterium]